MSCHLSVAEMRMRWICGHTKRDRVRNDDVCERLGVALVEEKLVQHRLRWFGYMQRRPADALIRNGVIRRIGNKKRGKGRSNLIWEESVKRDLNDWCITKELALDRRVESSNSCARILIFNSFFLLSFVKFFFLPFFCFFYLAFYCLLFFYLIFYRALFSPYFSLLFRSCGFISSLPQLTWE
jgi:hypothetical protein